VCDAYGSEEWAFSKKIQWDLPLKEAYEFAAANGLGVQAEAIRKKSLRWKSRTSAVRAGYMILLLQSKGLFETFQKEYWPNYETEGGQKEYRNYFKLVMMTSVLEPKHYYH
jgi:hypothetical protein